VSPQTHRRHPHRPIAATGPTRAEETQVSLGVKAGWLNVVEPCMRAAGKRRARGAGRGWSRSMVDKGTRREAWSTRARDKATGISAISHRDRHKARDHLAAAAPGCASLHRLAPSARSCRATPRPAPPRRRTPHTPPPRRRKHPGQGRIRAPPAPIAEIVSIIVRRPDTAAAHARARARERAHEKARERAHDRARARESN